MRTPQPASNRPAHPARALALLTAATALVLSPLLFADFIRLDDYSHLFDNPHLRSASGLAALWTKPFFNLYIPVTYSLWWMVAMVGRAFGTLRENAWLFHALNLIVHLVNAGLVFALVRRLLHMGGRDEGQDEAGDDTVALIAALVFALHPVQVESVAWVSELKGVLATLFGLLGLCCHFRSGRRALAAGFFVAAMLCKPLAIVFPGIVLVVNRVLLGMDLRKSAALPALYTALLLPFVYVTKRLQPDDTLDFIPTAAQRLLVAADALAFYVGKVLLPTPLAVDYGRSPLVVVMVTHTSGWRITLSALVALAGVAILVKALVRPKHTRDRGHALMMCGWSVFLLSLAPVLGFIPFGFQEFSTVADHYLYVPLLGVALIGAGVVVRVHAFAHTRRIAALVIVAWAGLSFQQARLWRSTETLFSHTLQVNPRSYLAAHAIDEEHLHAGRLDRAIEWATRALATKPDYVKAQISLGLAWSQKGEIERAIQHYTATLAQNPSTVGTRAKPVSSLHNNLGMVLLQVGREAEAVEQFRQAIAIFPRSLNAHLNLARVAFANERYQDAISELEAAQTLDPANPNIRQGLDRARHMVQATRPAGALPSP